MIETPWNELPEEIRKVLLLVNGLIDTQLRPTADFPTAFVDPYIMRRLEEAMNPIRRYYHLSILKEEV